MATLNLGRALTARIATRFIRLVTFTVLAVFGVIFIICGLLAYFFSAWWWFLIVPFLVILGIALIVRLALLLVIKRIQPAELTQEQSGALDGFVDKVQALVEARTTPPWVFALISLKDLVLHRDITTIKSIINSTATLKREYQELEKLF